MRYHKPNRAPPLQNHKNSTPCTENNENYSTFLTRTALVQTRANPVLNSRPKYSTCTKSIHYFSTCTIVFST